MFIKKSIIFFTVLFLISSPLFAATETAPTISFDKAFKQLKDGNERFVQGKMIHPHQDAERRGELTENQKPFAIVVSCSDSRVPTEIVFDQGIGDIFAVRVAGNIIDNTQLASIEYAVKYLGASLIVVLGHGQCGAVNAAIKGYDEPNYIEKIVKQIQPAVKAARAEKGDLLENAIKENVKMMDRKMEVSGNVLPQQIRDGRVRILGAYYHLDSGEVEFLPEQERK